MRFGSSRYTGSRFGTSRLQHGRFGSLSISLLGGQRGGGFSPLSLFGNDENGVFLDFNNTQAVFEDRAGGNASMPAVFSGLIGTVLDQTANGLHAVASLDGTRATFRRQPSDGTRNLIRSSVDPTEWDRLENVTASVNGEIISIRETAGENRYTIRPDTVGGISKGTISFEARPVGRTKLQFVVFTGAMAIEIDLTAEDADGNPTYWQRTENDDVIYFADRPDGFKYVELWPRDWRGSGVMYFRIADNTGETVYQGDPTKGVDIRFFQAEERTAFLEMEDRIPLANIPLASDYQRVVNRDDITEDGVDDILSIGNVASSDLLWEAPAGTYTEVYGLTDGTLQVLSGQSLDGPTNALLAEDQTFYLAISRPLVAQELDKLGDYADRVVRSSYDPIQASQSSQSNLDDMLSDAGAFVNASSAYFVTTGGSYLVPMETP